MEMMLLVDNKKCTGCRLCEMVCSVKHTGSNNPGKSRIHVIKWPMQGLELPMMCVQCVDAPCVEVCTENALSQDTVLNRVIIDYDLCIGCKTCVSACPFGSMVFDVDTERVIKCDLCEGDPACVHVCDPGALEYLPAKSVALVKKRAAGWGYAELMRKITFTDPLER
jgi:Fe-S-cluster-containing hydrogenase component 2